MTASRDEECFVMMIGNEVVDMTETFPPYISIVDANAFFPDMFFDLPKKPVTKPLVLLLLVAVIGLFLLLIDR